jgi:hypothetical protein
MSPAPRSLPSVSSSCSSSPSSSWTRLAILGLSLAVVVAACADDDTVDTGTRAPTGGAAGAAGAPSGGAGGAGRAGGDGDGAGAAGTSAGTAGAGGVAGSESSGAGGTAGAAGSAGAAGIGGASAGSAGASGSAAAGSGGGGDAGAAAGTAGTAGAAGQSGAAGSGAVFAAECTGQNQGCTLVDDCCNCLALGPGETAPACDIAECKASACASLGGPSLGCNAGHCTLDVSCGEAEVTCKAVKPTCEKGLVPAVAESCWTGDCVPVTECSRVSSCDACDAAGLTCVVNSTNSAFPIVHCIPQPSVCTEPSCACMGEAVCSDGSGVCDDSGPAIVCSCPTC